MSSYYLYHQGQQIGPVNGPEIVVQFSQKAFDATTYIFDEIKKDWVLLVDHPLFAQVLNKPLVTKTDEINAQMADQMAQLVDHRRQKKWFILRGESKVGPFNMIEVVQMLQDKKLFDFDHVWNSSMNSWKRIAECDDFSKDRIRSLKNHGDREITSVFKKRQHVRVQYDSQILVHNNKNVWKGQSYEIGVGGAGLVIANSALDLNQSLFLHFKLGEKIPPFNAICTVVNKQSASATDSMMKYGVKFTNISKSIQDRINEFSARIATGLVA